jgi:acyl carrier protein
MAPGTSMEKLVADIWKEILQLDAVGIHDNFFEIGGNSISILKMQGKLKKALEKDIPVVKLFKYPTIHTLALFLHEEKVELELSEEIARGKERLKERVGVSEGKRGTGMEVAIIGMAGVFQMRRC